jgi:predicted nucleotidyltransferase
MKTRSLAHCYRCAYVWRPRRSRVRMCARCKSRYFDFPKIPVPTFGNGAGIDQILSPDRDAILKLARRFGARNVRVFGSVARHAATPTSDVDLLVDPVPGRFRPVDLALALKDLLARKVDLVTETSLFWYTAPQVVAEAIPL